MTTDILNKQYICKCSISNYNIITYNTYQLLIKSICDKNSHELNNILSNIPSDMNIYFYKNESYILPGISLVHHAIMNNSLECLKILNDRGFNLHLSSPSYGNLTPLQLSEQCKSNDDILYFLKN